VEAYLARGMHIDDFAQNLSFFFSNGMDPEYTVLGRVARRIWAVALRDRYGANERSQKLKYHVQTSGRSAARAGDRSSTTSAPRCRR
jgi:methylmalonyl-CoA mutase